jgi:hypothetical protein
VNTNPSSDSVPTRTTIAEHYLAAFRGIFNRIMSDEVKTLTSPATVYDRAVASAIAEVQAARRERFAIVEDSYSESTPKLKSDGARHAVEAIHRVGLVAAEAAGYVALIRWAQGQNEIMAMIGDDILRRVATEDERVGEGDQ